MITKRSSMACDDRGDYSLIWGRIDLNEKSLTKIRNKVEKMGRELRVKVRERNNGGGKARQMLMRRNRARRNLVNFTFA